MALGLRPGRVFEITLARPERRNALDSGMLEALRDGLDAAAHDDEARCVLLQGEGEHFCAGADFGDLAASAEAGAHYGDRFEALLQAIEGHPLPVVAKVQGAALGAGCQILAACDLTVAAHNARIGIPSARIGLLLDLEKIQRMVRVAGMTVTRQMLLAGRDLTGHEAAERGLVTFAVPRDKLDYAVRELCDDVASCAPLSVRGAKAALRAIAAHAPLDRTRDAGLFADHDRAALEALGSSDLKEGLAALAQRRRPEFNGS